MKHKKTLSVGRYERNKQVILPTLISAIHAATTIQSNQNTSTTQYFPNIQHAIQTVIEYFEKAPRPRRKPWCSPRYKKQIKKQHSLYKKRIDDPTPEHIKKTRKIQKRTSQNHKSRKETIHNTTAAGL